MYTCAHNNNKENETISLRVEEHKRGYSKGILKEIEEEREGEGGRI